MKKTLFTLSLFWTTAAFGQYLGGGYTSSQPTPYQPPIHTAHASYAPLSTGTSIMVGTGIAIAQGERPVSDFPQPPETPLGTTARELKKQHEHDKKSPVVWEN